MTSEVGSSEGRCPHCGARLADGAVWCSLCFADLRPGGPPPPADAPRPAGPPPPGPSTLGVPEGARPALIDAPPPVGPPVVATPTPPAREPTRAEPAKLPDPLVEQRSEAMLAELAAAEQAARPAVLERFSSRGSRIGLMIGGTVALALLLVAAGWLVGTLFGGR